MAKYLFCILYSHDDYLFHVGLTFTDANSTTFIRLSLEGEFMDEDEEFNVEYDEKICTISGVGDEIDLDRLRSLIKDSRYICSNCGRSASSAGNLCAPERL